MDQDQTRRDILKALGAGAFFLLPRLASAQTPAQATGEAEPFSFERLREMARDLAGHPFQPMAVADPDIVDRIDYDAHNQISYRREDTLWKDQGDRSPVQFFFPGRYFPQPVHIYAVEDGMAREVPFSLDLFDIPQGNPARELTRTDGFAGFRVMNPDMKSDWMAFLGAAYWRTSGYSGQFGLSVRGLAMDTAMPDGPEEFPRFTRFWLEPGEAGALTAYALMESPRATGAYRIASRQEDGIIQDVEAAVFLRGDVGRMGLAPLTSMFWYGKMNERLATDWRPEIHDSDGLEILSGTGERLWRPLNNPPRTMANAFSSPSVQGFGLMQRERDFERYQDDGVFYEKRASVWVAPTDDWGDGAVTLVEIPTNDEIHDNIVAMWTPGGDATAGTEYNFGYTLSWLEDSPVPQSTGRFGAIRIGKGGVPGQPRPEGVAKIVCDFDGMGLEGLGRGDGVTLEVSVSRGETGNADVFPVVSTDYWRAMFDLDFSSLPPEDETPVDVRLYVTHDGDARTETLLLQLFPSQLRNQLDGV
ncbi:glucan biosynthesis protein [Mangrovicoccus algicola]|uniref:Glucan biosynthesis protein D n=1 Tax=Mangrovicoccus algicola TaxID=2771008 RepID=A0A8J6Z625_9RHOB|nr:glucan biosynthesis protein D [Mangrovicoccus algicola]MBE3637055.1 glucan biosynthesis protein D [Mangrovicoccus algicola]